MEKKDLDWKNLGFEYIKTNGYVYSKYKDGKWSDIKFSDKEYFPIHIGANVLHYGQACFEGIKAFTTKDGRVAIFRPDMSAKRINKGAARACMQEIPEDLFLEALTKVIKKNIEFMPPYGTGASMYIRPVLIGSGPTIGVTPADEYTFFVIVTPVGPYYKEGFFPVKSIVIEEYDRAAPRGTGATKLAGNYAAGILATKKAKSLGYPIVLYLDPKEKKFVDEFGTSNFIGVTKDGKFKTPSSSSILPSITNDSLQTIAKEMGIEVVKEKIAIDDLDQFAEVGACGTAAVITPIYSVTYRDTTFTFGEEKKAGEILTKLYNELEGIRYGEVVDKYGWLHFVE